MSNPSLTPNNIATKKPYGAFNFAAPIDDKLGVPNYYFQLIDVSNADYFFKIHLKTDDFLGKIGQSGDNEFDIWLPTDSDYKNFDYYLVLNKEFTKPTFLVTLATRPTILVQEKGDFITVVFIEKNHKQQQVLIDKVRMRVIYLQPLFKPGVMK